MAVTGRVTPRQGIEAECRRRGKLAVVSGCIDLLEGREDNPRLKMVAEGGSHRPVKGAWARR